MDLFIWDMHVTRNFAIIYFLAATIFACDNKSSTKTDDDTAALLRIHEESRDAHFNKNAQAMVDQFAENMVSVSGGRITNASREKGAKSFQSYFDQVEFRKWDDVKAPEIRFSDDHSIAYLLVDKLVVLETKDSLGKPVEETTHYAWVSIYRKQQNGGWKLECIASTTQPEEVRAIQ
jgi:ketosteroid isomerase-like protein